MLSRPEAGEPTGARGQFGGFLSRSTEMAGSACGAPVGGSARESNHAPAKGTIRAAELPPQTRAHSRHEPTMCAHSSKVSGRIVAFGKMKPAEVLGDVASNRRGSATIPRCRRPRAGLRRTPHVFLSAAEGSKLEATGSLWPPASRPRLLAMAHAIVPVNIISRTPSGGC